MLNCMNQYGNKDLIYQQILDRCPVKRLISALSSGQFWRITMTILVTKPSRGLIFYRYHELRDV